MSPFALTKAQLRRFDTFGYLAFPAMLATDIGAITAAFEQVWADHGGGHHGAEHDGTRRSCIVPFIDQHEDLCALLDDERIHGILCGLLGQDFNYTGSDGNYYAGDTQWHSDGWGGRAGRRFVKIAFYLDPVSRDGGCLRVIPGSHRQHDAFAQDLQDHIRDSPGRWGLEGASVPAVALETTPGDIVVFNHDLKHAAFGGSSRRRMFTINCSERFAEADLPVFRDYISGHARFWAERLYGQTMVDTAGPQRRVHLEQGLANDGHLAALVAQARQQMPEPSRG